MKKNRKQRGGNLTFHYTRNPARIAWTTAVYDLCPRLLQMINSIPWSSYRYEGPTLMGFLNNEEGKEDEVILRKEHIVTATPFQTPYNVFGGYGCEVFNMHYTGEGSPRLHDTVDPTADVDCQIQSLKIRLQDSFSGEEAPYRGNIFFYMEHDGRLSAVYEAYTQWIFEQVCEKLQGFEQYVSSSPFVKKYKEGNAETENANLERHIGNFLVTRSNLDTMVKIQIGVGVQYGENKKVSDHCLELVLTKINDPLILFDEASREDNHFANFLVRIEPISATYPFGTIVSDIPTSLREQTTAFVSRTKDAIEQTHGDPEELSTYQALLGHKYLNHYGRMVYLLKLLKYVQANISKKQMGPKGSLFYGVLKELSKRHLREMPIPMCHPVCDFDMLHRIMDEIVAYRPPQVPKRT